MRPDRVGLAGFVAVAAAAAFLYPRLPARVPVHFDLYGNPNGWASRLVLVLFAPGLVLATWALLTALLRVDPKVRAGEKAAVDAVEVQQARSAREAAVSAAVAMIATMSLVLLALGAQLLHDAARAMSLAVAAFLLVFGNFLGRVRPSFFIGIRTPWTLSDDEVWRRTHRLGGRLMVLAGGLLVLLALTLPVTWLGPAMAACVAVAVVPPAVFSYLLWRRRTAS